MSGMSSLSEPHIRAQDIAAALRDLGKKVTKQEVQTMLWEADEKNDGLFINLFIMNLLRIHQS